MDDNKSPNQDTNENQQSGDQNPETPQTEESPFSAQMERAIAEMDRAIKGLDFSLRPRSQVPENIFYHHFLPFFAGRETIEPVELEHWLRVAGGPTMEVNVVNEKGEVVHVVPAIADTSIFDTVTTIGRKTMTEALFELAQTALVRPKLAADLKEELFKVKGSGHNTDHEIDHYRRWAEIFRYYGYLDDAPTSGSAEIDDSALDDAIDDWD